MNDLNPMAAFAESMTPKRAVTYLRVSTSEQATKGGQAEGFSTQPSATPTGRKPKA